MIPDSVTAHYQIFDLFSVQQSQELSEVWTQVSIHSRKSFAASSLVQLIVRVGFLSANRLFHQFHRELTLLKKLSDPLEQMRVNL